MNKIKLFNLTIIISFLMSCSYQSNGERILMVEIETESKPSDEVELVKESLQWGGHITICVDTMRKIDSHFDQNYAVSGSDGKFKLIPALLNAIGGNGWCLKFIESKDSFFGTNTIYYFTRPFKVNKIKN